MKNDEIKNYQEHYTEKSFFSKIIKYGKFLGKGLLTKIILLYYVFKDKKTPDWVKTTIIGALGYFILPLDLIPDLVPIAGFSDDFATILSAVSIISSHITAEHKYMADITVRDIFEN